MTAEHDFNYRGPVPGKMVQPVAASAVIQKGNMVVLNSSGLALEGTTVAGGAVIALGRAQSKVDNTGGGGSALDVEVQIGVMEWINSTGDPVDQSSVGTPVYVEDEKTVAKTSGSGTLIAAGIMTEITVAGKIAVFMGPAMTELCRAVAEADAGVALQKRSLHLTTSNVNAASTSQVINLGAALPNNARILGIDVRLATATTGITGPVIVKVGSAGDDDAILASANLTTAAVDGESSTHTLGIAPNKTFASSTQLIATAVSSSGNLSSLSTLDATVDVLFAVLA
jgi:hypothetical protein